MKLLLPIYPEPSNPAYSMYNTGGVEVEVGEFLYGLVRMIKPEAILETGTHKGISASYMATALKENGKGKITTLEFEPQHWEIANNMFQIMGLQSWIISSLQDASTYPVKENEFDFIFLDTEPHLRFAEFLRYWPALKPGGFVGIHDLGPGMGQSGQTVNGVFNWPFGTLPEEMKRILKEEIQSFHFKTPRGLYLGQKKAEDFYE